jgi:hypothetical protein
MTKLCQLCGTPLKPDTQEWRVHAHALCVENFFNLRTRAVEKHVSESVKRAELEKIENARRQMKKQREVFKK